MKRIFVAGSVIAAAIGLASPVLAQTAGHPVKITAADPAALTTPDTVREAKGSFITHDRLMGATPDKKTYTAGMYSATASRDEVASYSVDEFMYFIKGGVTLTSADGTVTQVNPGDAVYIQKGWKGVWDTAGYTKYYVIYEPAASPAAAQAAGHPVKITAADPGALATADTKTNDRGNGRVSKDRLMGESADKKFNAGIYSATASKFTTEGYAVDEFMYFIKGGVTLTSADGTVTQVNAGDAVFLPRGWKGVWDTAGYTKYYGILEERPAGN